MNLENLLRYIIEVYGNDIQCGLERKERANVAPVISELIIALTRLLLNFRYCSRKECPCSPEYMIRHLVHKHKEIYEQYLEKEHVQRIIELTQK